MDLVGILLIFVVITGTTRLKKPLWLALALAAAVAGLAFRMPLGEWAATVLRGATSTTTLTLLAVVYCLTFLQQLMSQREMLQKAEKAMTRLLNDRRLSLAITPGIIGLLPAPGAVLMAASVVEGSCKDYMSREDMAFVSTFFRHVPESSLPTYTGVILATTLAGVGVAPFLLSMIPYMVVLMAVPYWIYLRRVPRETGGEGGSRLQAFREVLATLWPIILAILLILVLQLPTLAAALVTIAALVLLGRYDWKEAVLPNFRSAFNPTMLASSFCAMIFKEVLGATGAVSRLPQLFEGLPIPLFLIFALVIFVGTIVGGLQTMVTMVVPTAMAALPEVGAPLLMFLMATGHLGSQLCPIHLCITLAAEYFHVGLGDIFKRTIPVAAVVFAFTLGYYLLLTLVF